MFDLKLGFRCNNNCVHCVVADKRKTKDLSLDEIYYIIDNEIPEQQRIQLTGGEPTIYKDLPKILARCREKGHKTIIQTNGTGFADQAFFNECKDNMDHVHIAIHSCYPEIHDAIVQSEGMWEKTIKGFENLLNDGHILVTTQTVLSRLNIVSLYDTFKFIQGKAPGILMSMTYPHVMGNAYANREKIIFRYSEYKDEIQRTLAEFKDNIFTESIPPCYQYPNFSEGSLERDIICGVSRIGVDFSGGDGVKNYNLLDVQDKRKGPRCKECVFNNECIGVWKEYFEQFGKKLDLFPITKDMVKEKPE